MRSKLNAFATMTQIYKHKNIRGKLVAVTIFAAVALGMLSAYMPNSSAMNGGTVLTTRQERIGIFEIHTYDASTIRGGCTGTVLYSSAVTNRTWLVTAAHCFSYHDDLFYVYGHFANPRARIIYDVDSDTSGTSEVSTSETNSTVWVWPEWLQNGGHTAWFGPKDIAFIRVNQAIPIYDADGVRINEFRRPLYTGPAFQVSEPYVSASMKNFSKNAFCGQGDGQLSCDTLSNLWWSPNFRNNFFQLPNGAWQNGGFYEAGDSGGPLIKYAPRLTRQWEGSGDVLKAAMHGAVLGVLQGPTVFCDYIQNANCNPSDGLASSFEGTGSWVRGFAGTDIPQILSWTPFNNQFLAGVGDIGTTLTAVDQNSYTFPAYAGKIVGIGVDKSTNQVHTWYDNGVMTIGTRSDLDIYSQASAPAPLPDLLPTRFFSGVPGKANSQIVAMAIDPTGRVFSWYDDATTVIGSINNLDSIQGPQTYQLPSGKTPRDIVGIASRAGGSFLAYYRDGTVSEGLYWDLDLLAPPTPFQTGGRDPKDILGIDTFSNGRTLTLFRHPTM